MKAFWYKMYFNMPTTDSEIPSYKTHSASLTNLIIYLYSGEYLPSPLLYEFLIVKVECHVKLQHSTGPYVTRCNSQW